MFGVFCHAYSMYQKILRELQEATKNPDTDRKVIKLYEKILRESWDNVLMLGREFFLVPDDDSKFLIIPAVREKRLCQKRIKSIG